MKQKYFDRWTIWHFIFGFISTSILFPSKPIISAIVANIVHLIGELTEINESPDKKILEYDVNHLGDILFFFFGSLLGVIYGTNLFVKPEYNKYRYPLFFFTILGLANEIGRELLPYDWPYYPAFKS